MSNPDRLTGLDASFLALEDAGAHMHVGSCMLFEGEAPDYEDFVAQVDSRLHLVPRYRQKLAFPPLTQARPVWVDDPHFNPGYHVRHTALPEPASLEQLRNLTGRVLAQRLDRGKPLWELWLVQKVEGGRFAIISKTHHCLVDGVSGVDIATVLFDLEEFPRGEAGDEPLGEVAPPEPPRAWFPRPEPTPAALIADAVAEGAGAPLGAVRLAAGAIAHPERTAGQVGKAVAGLGAVLMAGLQGAPASPYNLPIGPHRRFAWVDGDLAQFKSIKSALGGTVNDIVLSVVAGALRSHMQANGHEVDGVELKAMVPMSVRAEAERGALGNRVTAMYAPLPVYAADPVERFEAVHEAMKGLKESGQAVGAEMITQLAGFAPPTVLSQASRLQSSQRLFNVVVTNVPGPQFPLYILGRRLLRIYPQVPLVTNTALGIAIMSYDGTINFGLLGDYDALPDLDDLAAALRDAIAELAAAAGVPPANGRAPRDAAPARSHR
jgi:diacylglycerol O-acyltransferase